MKPHPAPALRQQGFTLVEVLVSTVVALFAALAIIQTFAVAEGYRRTGAGSGDASFNGALGAYVIAHDIAVAGYGINTAAYLGCPVTGTDVSGTTPRAIGPFTLAPVAIAAGVNAQTPDAITLVASDTTMMPGPLSLTANMVSPTSDYTVLNAYGVNAGDVLFLAQGGAFACALAQATNTPAATNQNVILHASGTYSAAGTSHVARYNPGGGSGGAYTAGSVVIDMGQNPLVSTYYVQNNSLMVDQIVAGQLTQPVATNIVQLKAFYGKDTNADGIVDTWDQVNPAAWNQVLAVRLAVAARSVQPEKPDPTTGLCTTTTALPRVTWEDGSWTDLDVSQTASTAAVSWQCYRYRTFHVTTSLRNLIWTPS